MTFNATQLSLFDSRQSNDRFAVRVSTRARRLTARVHVGGRVEIVVPVGIGPKTVSDFVRRFTPWINAKVNVMQGYGIRSHAVQDQGLPTSVDFALTGERFDVHWHSCAPSKLTEIDQRLEIQAPDFSTARALLCGWLKRAASLRLASRLFDLAGTLGFRVDKVTIRTQRTRWGSCSARGTLSLNASLMFQTSEVVHYLFVHELAHIRHMNHSSEFWRLVESIEPKYRQLDRELLAGWHRVPAWVFKN